VNMQQKRLSRLRVPGIIAAVALIAASLSSPAPAQDPQTNLAEAEAEVGDAQADISAAAAALEEAQAKQSPIQRQANKAVSKTENAAAEVEELSADLVAAREDAAEEVAVANASYQEEKDQHDTEVGVGLGVGLALLLLALLPFRWGRFRSSPVVQRLAAEDNSRAYGIVGAVALTGVIVGGVVADGGTGLVDAVASFVIVLLIGLVCAVFLARQQTLRSQTADEPGSDDGVPRGRRRIMLAVLATLGVLFLASPLFAESPEEPEFSEETLALAALAEEDVTETASDELKQAMAALKPLKTKSDRLESRRSKADRAVRQAKNRLSSAEQRLREAENQVQLVSRQIERAEARAQRRAEREAERADEEDSADGGGSDGCEPGYDPCVPTYPPDLNCDDLDGPYTVTGSDPHGLDADGDGVGCET
jgi:hypothetical protein